MDWSAGVVKGRERETTGLRGRQVTGKLPATRRAGWAEIVRERGRPERLGFEGMSETERERIAGNEGWFELDWLEPASPSRASGRR